MNYCKANELLFEKGKVCGLECEDMESGAKIRLRASCVINATGVWVDALREQDGRVNHADGRRPTKPMVAPSQGLHLVVDREFLADDVGLMVPKTADGRVLFAVPRRGGVHPVRGGALPEARADPRRRAQHVGWPAAAGQTAGRRRRQHQGSEP